MCVCVCVSMCQCTHLEERVRVCRSEDHQDSRERDIRKERHMYMCMCVRFSDFYSLCESNRGWNYTSGFQIVRVVLVICGMHELSRDNTIRTSKSPTQPYFHALIHTQIHTHPYLCCYCPPRPRAQTHALIHRWSIVDTSLIHRWFIVDPQLIYRWSIVDPSLI